MDGKLNRRSFLVDGAMIAAAGAACRARAGGEARAVGGRTFVAACPAQYPGKSVPEFIEPFEVSEYGRAPNEDDFRILVG